MTRTYGTIRVEPAGDGVTVVTLDRPDKRNVISQTMRDELVETFHALPHDGYTRAVILTGAGDTAFCAGTDVSEFVGRPGIEQWRRDCSPSRLFEVIERCPLPIIAMLNGYAFGGGCELALACDMRSCSDRAEIGLLEVNFGLIPGGGGTQRLARLVGRGQAMRIVLSGDRITAAEAYRIGLVEFMHAAHLLRDETIAFARRLTRHDAIALELVKASIAAADEVGLAAGLRYEGSLMAMAMQSGEHERRIGSFMRKGDAR